MEIKQSSLGRRPSISAKFAASEKFSAPSMRKLDDPRSDRHDTPTPSKAPRRFVHALARATWRLLRRTWQGINDYRIRRAGYRELRALSERQLLDIGISPNDFEAIVKG